MKSFRKILSTNLLIFALALFTPTIILAQDVVVDEPAVIEDVEGLRATFKQYTQEPGSKVAKFEMTLKSEIDSDRVEVEWTVKGSSVFTTTAVSERSATIEKGKTYVVPITIVPVKEGTTELVGTVKAYKVDSTYIATVRKNFLTNANREVLPLTDEYLKERRNYNIQRYISTIGIMFVVLSVLGYMGLRFSKWLNRDDVKSYDAKK